MKSEVIETTELRKTYKNGTVALDGISFGVERGEIFGFLGPNGAGKTTTVSILTTILKKSSGEARINGIDVDKEPQRIRKTIGLVFQASTNDNQLTGRENLEYLAGLNGLSIRSARTKINELLTEMGLLDAADNLVSSYSGGMKRKLEIAAAIVHEPEVLFLDEPTLGLDPSSRTEFWDYIRRIKKDHETTIFVNTHYLEEADQLCDKVAIIDHGKIIASGSPSQLKGKLRGDLMEVIPRNPDRDISTILEKVGNVTGVTRRDGSYLVRSEDSGEVIPGVVLACRSVDMEIRSIVVHKPSLEQVFLEITGHKYEGNGDNVSENGHIKGDRK